MRVSSPSSGSILTISAPWSASSMVQERARQHLREIDDADSVQRSQDVGHLSPQWLRRLISTVRSPSKTCLSSWFTP